MKHSPDLTDIQPPKPILPYWVMDGSVAQTSEFAGFSSGSALALLHVQLENLALEVPANLLRNRFALSAATHCLRLDRYRSGKTDLLDAYYFTKPGDERGPAGDMLAFWLKACAVNLGHRGWQDRVVSLVPGPMQEDVYGWLGFSLDGSGPQSPVRAATNLLQTVYDLYPQNETIAFLLADLRLAHDLRWPYPFPFFGQYLTGKELRASTDDLLIDAHRAVATAAQEAVRQAYDLSRRSAQLRAVTPQLRAKAAEAALPLFLSELAVAPSSMLAPKIKGTNVPMTSRAARRLCDRLVDFGVVKELTGRSTFRLYGLLP